ncbi:MAG: nucleoside kinase [Prevotella sp.]|nr:nucleoside kinase [Candidatus Equicola stercoris]
MLKIFCKNTGETKDVQDGCTLLELLDIFHLNNAYPIISAKINNVSQGLKFRLYHNRDVEFLDLRDASAMRVYTRSLSFVLCKAVHDLYRGTKIHIEHPVSNGLFCSIETTSSDDLDTIVCNLQHRMREIISNKMPFHRHEVHMEEAIELFRERKVEDKIKLLETSGKVYTDYYTLDDFVDYYYGRLVPDAGYLNVFGLERYANGFILQLPDHNNPTRLADPMNQPRTLEMFTEARKWNNIMHLRTVGDVNHACLDGKASELIQVSEALQEKKIVQIAEEISRRHGDKKNPLKVVLISGPSSSGKTTFCKRISIQLMACGITPISMSTDDYFVNRLDTPLLPDGRFDFDNFDTVDHEMLQQDVIKMLEGEEIEVPEYNFRTGKREFNGKKMKLDDNSVLLIEGIHALNPLLTNKIEDNKKFRIFISTLTCISLDDHNVIPPTDNRLLRRIVRDYNKGAFSARDTISQWPSVCEAEEKWIKPYQESADMMFNSALLIELAVLRNHAEPILATVPKNCPEYAEAHRLFRFLNYFIPVSDKEVPPTSLLREFLGGSSFTYRV